MSSQLSIALVIGLTLVPILPGRTPPAATATQATAPSIVASLPQATPIPPAKAPAPTAPVVPPEPAAHAPPSPGPQTPAAASPTSEAPAGETDAAKDANPTTEAKTAAIVLAQARRDRRASAPARESGELGKAAEPPPTPVTPKSDTAKAEPEPEPDEWSDAEIIVALKDCLKRLTPLGAEVEIAPAVKKEQCGAPAPVLLKRVGSGENKVDFQPAPMLNCAMVAGLHAWIENTVQPAAEEYLGSRIARLRNVSGYSCRNRAGTRFNSHRLSEHALANAIDIGSFVTADGRTIDVKRDWGPTLRDIRKREIEIAEAKLAAAQKERERLEAELKAEWEKLEKDKADLPPAGKTKAERQARQKAQAELRQRERDLKKRETEVNAAEAVEEREAERRRQLEREPLKSEKMQRLGRGADSDRRPIPVAGWKREDSELPSEAYFLRRLHKGACGTFGTVLGPEANEAHRDHFHLDLAPRRRSAYCE